MVLFTKHHLIFMSSETISENKLASIASIKASNDVDLVRSYLRDIGRVPLLSHEQEITLGRQVQEYMQVERVALEINELTGDKPSIDELRYSIGVGLTWITGFGPMSFAISKPYNEDRYERTEDFQFTIGTVF